MRNLLKIRGLAFYGRAALAALLLAVCAPFSQAATYIMPSGDVIGRVQYATVKTSETLADVARNYDVGFDELVAANPHVDPWVPEGGTKLLIPSRYVLPSGKRNGIVINIAEKRLYFFSRPSDGPPLVSTYPVSFGPSVLKARLGNYKVDQRVRKPTWNVSSEDKRMMKNEGRKVDSTVIPGRDNIMGEFSIGLAGTNMTIHGTNKPYSIGMDVDYGYVRMYPEDIENLVHRVAKDTPVRFVNETFKYGYKNGALYFELHKPKTATGELNHAALVNWMRKIVKRRMWADDWRRIRTMVEQSFGLAMPIFQEKPKPAEKRTWMLKLASYKSIKSARAVMNKIEQLGVPMSIDGCVDDQLCTVMAGPFRNLGYMEELRKKIKWMTRIKAYRVVYEEVDDFLPLDIPVHVANVQEQ